MLFNWPMQLLVQDELFEEQGHPVALCEPTALAYRIISSLGDKAYLIGASQSE